MNVIQLVNPDKRELFKEVFDMIDISCDTDVSKMIEIVNGYTISDSPHISKFEIVVEFLQLKQLELLEKVKQNDEYKSECIAQGIKDVAYYTLYEDGKDILTLAKISNFIVDLQNNIRRMKSYVR